MTFNVVKIGGSLSQNSNALKALCQKIGLLANRYQIVVVPGGGKFADCVREADKQFSLSDTAAHRMAILAMDQYGLLLADFIPNNKNVDTIEEAKKVKTGKITVFLPSKFMVLNKEIPNSWEVTSDTIAAYVAKKLEADNLLLLKDVDGIFTDDPKKNVHTQLFEQITIEELSEMKNKTCIDTYLPKMLKTFKKINCHIINGFYPDRIETALNKQKTTGTTITVT